MLSDAQVAQWEGTTEPLFVGPALYGEIEKHIAETRPIVGWVDAEGNECEEGPDAFALQTEHAWEAEAVAPMIVGREVYCTAWTAAPSKEERENDISLAEVLGNSNQQYAGGVDVKFVQ